MKEVLKDEVSDVRFTNKLTNHPVCLTTNGELSTQMEKVLNALPESNNVKANMILEINDKHPIVKKLNELYKNDQDSLKNYDSIQKAFDIGPFTALKTAVNMYVYYLRLLMHSLVYTTLNRFGIFLHEILEPKKTMKII